MKTCQDFSPYNGLQWEPDGSSIKRRLKTSLLFYWRKKKHISWMAWGWGNYQQIFIFGWTIHL